MRSILAVLILIVSARGIAAQPVQNPLTYVQTGQWAAAQAAAAQTGDPVADKLIVWLRMLTPNAAGASEIAAFNRQSPDWPLPGLIERRRQEAITAEPNDTIVAALCTEKKPGPSPARGPALLRCADALANVGRAKEAAAIAREAWVTAISDPATEAVFARRFPGMVSAADQWARFQRLAWDDAAAAQRQLPSLDPAHFALATARLSLKAGVPVPIVRPDEDPGAMLDLARIYRKLGQDQTAVALWRATGLQAQKAAPDHQAAFWVERQFLARQLLRDGNAQGAYEIVAGHGQTDPSLAADAEFFAGFIALRRLNDPAAALLHFKALAAGSKSVLSQSRAYYWLGRTDVVLGRDPAPDYARAATWPMTFYGQLSARASGVTDANLVNALRIAATPSTGLPATPVTAELTRAANLLIAWGDPRRARPFLLREEELARTPAERIAVGDYAASIGLPDVTVSVARRLGRDGVMPPMQGWPVPFEPPPVPEPAVSLGIMRQESNFDVSIVSSAGARGLMQLMPATARLVAHRLGEPTSDVMLTADAGHNMRMGTAYLQQMLEKFGNFVPMAAAAYNAGPNRVTQWLTENGDPRIEGQSMIDWIELIPFNETRNYVQRVLENVVVYQARRTGTLPVMMMQWTR